MTALAEPTGAISMESVQQLIQETPALREDERQYWLGLLPTMTHQQLVQLQGILSSEQQNIEKIDQKYQGKLKEVGQKYLNKWDAEKAQVVRTKLREEEKAYAEEAEQKAEELLNSWE